MRKKAARKDFYMEIRKSPGRFLSILFIAALGVAFFSGIRSAEPSMRVTGDAYYDDTGLMDIKAVSTLGITGEDIRAIEKVDGVEKAAGAYSKDFLSSEEDQQVLHVMSLTEGMNEVAVTEGKMPENPGECLADDETKYKVGDEIVLQSGTDDPVSDTLKTEKLKVVGTGSIPCYISFSRGSTTIGTGSIDGFLIVPEESFDMDVYTEAYIQAEGTKGLLAYTEEYDDKVEEVIKNIEAITEERGQIRRQELVDDANKELDDARKELEEGKNEAKETLENAAEEIASAESKLSDGKKEIENGKNQIAQAKAKLNSSQKELDKAKEEYKSGVKQLEEGKKAYEKGEEEYQKKEAEAAPVLEENRKKLAVLQSQIEVDKTAYQACLDEIAELEKSEEITDETAVLLEEKKELAGQLAAKIAGEEQAYQQGSGELEGYQNTLDSARNELQKSKAELDAGEKELENAAAKIQSGQSEIDSGWSRIKKEEKTLTNAENEVLKGEAALADVRKQYEEGKKEAEEEIADGEKKIKDAEKEIEKIEHPKWYVYDRSTLPEYSGYGENADRMRAIGKVFPVIFFLVAALISLTSMTRMVEEQRTAIGTMKALGYNKFSIASKYLGYALLATVGGSIIGVLIGEKILPYIIIYAYGIMYHHIPEILVPYQWDYAVMASSAAVFCTTAATLTACYRELSAQPAVLMRPPAPKKGKRVFLERVKIIWRHLNFSWKSTVRNLMRYKKRFFMTVFGIGGCMALMLVGFGLRDSIFEIAQLQYTDIQVYHGNIYLQEDLTEGERENLKTFLGEDEDVEKFMDARMKNVTLVNGKKERQTVLSIMEDTGSAGEYVHFRDRKTQETYKLSDDGAIISEKTAKLLGIEAGDSIYIKDEDTGNKEVKISEICENYMGHYLYLTPEYYEKIYGEVPEYNCIFFITPDTYSKNQIEEAGQKILTEDEVLNVSYMHDIQKQLDEMLKSLNLVIVVLIISAGMLAFVVLYNLNNINITERQRELATLKVLGFYNPEVGAYVYRENILLTFVGTVVGAGFGKILHLFIIETVEVDSVMFGRIINFSSYVYSFLFTVAFSMIVNGVMYFKLKKIDMVESLKSIE